MSEEVANPFDNDELDPIELEDDDLCDEDDGEIFDEEETEPAGEGSPESAEEEVLNPFYREFDCRRCGKHVYLEYQDPNHPLSAKMEEQELCFHCVFWDELTEKVKDTDHYKVAGGRIYEYGGPLFPYDSKAMTVDVYTRYFIDFNLNPQVLNHSRIIATVPEGYDIPDNGRMIPKELYLRFYERAHFQCRAKGCYDRYHCAFYDAEKMERGGAWNEIPKRYRIGSEKCPSFIDKCKLFPEIYVDNHQ